jgi:nitrite reductase/ring-hydroxylating ferredoxin subunit
VARDEQDRIIVARVAQCPPGTCIELVAAGRMIALFNVAGEFFALDGVCPHQGGPLGKGALSGHIVTCPWHGWQFDVRTGRNQITPTICQGRIPVQVEGDLIVVRRQDLEESLS